MVLTEPMSPGRRGNMEDQSPDKLVGENTIDDARRGAGLSTFKF